MRVPSALRGDQGRLAEQIAGAEFQYCVFSETDDEPRRWPESGWLSGGIDDLAGLIEQMALSERRIAEGMRILEEGVSQAAKLLRVALKDNYPGVLTRIAASLHQEEGEQTSRMATAIFANALTVHAGIAGTHGVPPLDDLRSVVRKLAKGHVVEAWYYILDEINYWPIFKIALDVLLPIPDATAQQVLHRLHLVAKDLDGIGAVSTQDLAGQMFGRLIADRKFLATFYTLPSSAALLAELAVSKLDVDWGDAEAVKALRIADLACGTGVLLSATYRAVAARHRRGGGDDELLHRAMMESALVGADIMPAATHLTASMLSSAHPTLTFGRTRIHTMPYGMQEQASGRPPALGSLDLITSDKQPSLFGTGEHVLAGDDKGVEVGNHAERGDEIRLPQNSADLVIMNPPFTRPTNHEAGYEAPVPSFAGFATSADEQKHMSVELKKIRGRLSEPAGDGNAGLASNFIDLAHAKVKPGGVLALVLPITVVSGGAWAAARRLLARHYRDISVITLATTGQTGRSFSADTGMGEALIVAVKRDAPSGAGEADAPALYVNLQRRPRRTVDGAETARVLARLPSQATGLIHIGDEEIGCYVRASLADGGCASLREPGCRRCRARVGAWAHCACHASRTHCPSRLRRSAISARAAWSTVTSPERRRTRPAFRGDRSTSSRTGSGTPRTRCSGRTMRRGSAGWWSRPTARAASGRGGIDTRSTCGRRRRGCTSTSTSSSTRRASAPASRRSDRSAAGHGPTSASRATRAGRRRWRCGPTRRPA